MTFKLSKIVFTATLMCLLGFNNANAQSERQSDTVISTQTCSVSNSNAVYSDICYLFRLVSSRLSESNYEDIDKETFKLSPVTQGDSLLVILQNFTSGKETILNNIPPKTIKNVEVVRDKNRIRNYVNKEVSGIVIIEFKDEKDFWKIVAKD